MPKSLTAYFHDDRLRAEANAAGRNYWYRYIEELFDEVGLRADMLDLASAGDRDALAGHRVLVLGNFAVDDLPPGCEETLAAWVEDGGVLIGLATRGLDSLWGIEDRGEIGQPDGPFSCSAHLHLGANAYTTDVHMPRHPDQAAPVFSPCRRIARESADALAEFVEPSGPAVTARPMGKGRAFYFAFDLCQCVWVLHQGRPIDRDYDGDRQYRTCDQIVVPRDDTTEVAYADELLLVWTNMLAEVPQPFIHQIPPDGGAVPHFLIHMGGDDEGLDDGSQRWASDHFKSLGLPYHINIMPARGEFALSDEDFEAIRANGHETSLHPNFISPFGRAQQLTPVTESVLREQIRAYRERFGHTPVAAANHWCCWFGWVEPARWLAAEGIRGDNSRGSFRYPPLNPVNQLGMGFGTVFPHFVYDDHTQANARLGFVFIPIVYYEPGTGGGKPAKAGHPYPDGDPGWERLRFWLDMAVRYEWTLNCFIHPTTIFRDANTRAALDEILACIERRGYRVVFMGTDEVCQWWFDRSASDISAVSDADGLTFNVAARHKPGVIVRVPVTDQAIDVTVDDQRAQAEVREKFGRRWLYVPIPEGTHQVKIATDGSL